MYFMRPSRRPLYADSPSWPRELVVAGRYKMPERAHVFDESAHQVWMVAIDPWYKVVDARAIGVGADLMRTFIVELLAYHDAGWRPSDFGSKRERFFATKTGK